MIVNYVRKGGGKFNMVLLMQDDIPDRGTITVKRNEDEMREIYKEGKTVLLLAIRFLPHRTTPLKKVGDLFSHCESVYKGTFYICETFRNRPHPSGTMTLLGDSAHAPLPYWLQTPACHLKTP